MSKASTGSFVHLPLALQLPLEIKEEIFSIYCSINFDGIKTLKQPPSPLLLGSVCKAWRETTWSIPQLWTTVILKLTIRNYERQLKLLDLCSLSIYFEAMDQTFGVISSLEALEKLVEHSERWSHLDITIVDDKERRFVKLLGRAKDRVPQLQLVHIRKCQYMPGGYEAFVLSTDFLEIAPRLIKLSKSDIYLDVNIKVPWTQLTSLYYHRESSDGSTNDLLCYLNLTQLHLSAIYWNYSNESEEFVLDFINDPDSRTEFSYLSSLCIVNTDRHAIMRVLDTINCPALRELRLISIPSKESAFRYPGGLHLSTIYDFLQGINCPLEVLELGTDESYDRFASDNTDSRKVLPSLIKKLDEDTFLPHLVEFRYKGIVDSMHSYDYNQIEHVLQKRWTPVSGLSRLEIFHVEFGVLDRDMEVSLQSLEFLCGATKLRREGMDILIIGHMAEEVGSSEDNDSDE
ncbi:hypothetical protein BDQ17DRAFT_1365251 [Cyathus striatus]|nr:hypothetical protein BDQ17DRAFT_1365251 [Cyathus striatus]